jgi:hypothetical protein
MDFGSINAYVILGFFILGFIAVCVLIQVIGKNFAWHQELE